MTYLKWIEEYRARTRSTLGRCRAAVDEMALTFPELRKVAGHVFDARWGQRAHWWLVTEKGDIVDPTADQFPMLIEHVPFEPGQEVRVGKCMNCGEHLYAVAESLDDPPAPRTFCDATCHDAMAMDLGWPLPVEPDW